MSSVTLAQDITPKPATDGAVSADQNPTMTPEKKESPWSFEGIIGLPFDETGGLTLNGYGELEYYNGRWGVGGYAAYDSYEEGTDEEFNGLDMIEAEVWGELTMGEKKDPWRLNFEFGVEFNQRETEYESNAEDSVVDGTFEFSNFLIIYASAGFRHKVSEKFSYKFMVGAGIEQEYYSIEIASDKLKLEAEVDPGFYPAGLIDFEFLYKLAPGWVDLQHKTKIENYTVNHISLFFDEGEEETSESEGTDADGGIDTIETNITEASSNLYFNLTKLSFFGLCPQVYGGVEFYYEDADGETDSDLVTEFGVGITSTFGE